MALAIVNAYTGSHATTGNPTATVSASTDDWLVAMGAANGPVTTAQTLTCGGAGLTWATCATRTYPAGQPAGVGIFVARATGTISSQVITITRSNAGENGAACCVVVVSGGEATWGGATNVGSSASGLPSVSVTTTQANSFVFACSTDWSQKGLGAPGTGVPQTELFEHDIATAYTSHFWRTTNTVAAGATTLDYASPAAQQYNIVAAELREPGNPWVPETDADELLRTVATGMRW